MRFLNKLNGILMQICVGLAVLFLLVIALSLTLGIFMRLFFSTPLVGGDDFARLSMVWLAMICAPLGLYYSEHVSLSFLADRVSGLTAKLLQIAVLVCVFLVCFFALKYCGKFLSGGFSQKIPSIPWLSQGWGYVAVPVGFALTAWVSVIGILNILTGYENKPIIPFGMDKETLSDLEKGEAL